MDTALIRLVMRIGFWAFLVTAVLPGLKHADVFKEGINVDTLGRAAQLSMADIASFCARNPSVCQAGQSVASTAIVQIKSSVLTAYHGVRKQYDEPDRETSTAGISKE